MFLILFFNIFNDFLMNGMFFFGFNGVMFLISFISRIGLKMIGFVFFTMLNGMFIFCNGVRILLNKIILLGLNVLYGCSEIFIVRFIVSFRFRNVVCFLYKF